MKNCCSQTKKNFDTRHFIGLLHTESPENLIERKGTVTAECAEILKHETVNSEYRHLVVSCSPQAAQASPGQFFNLLCPEVNGEHPFFRRPMSLYGADPDNCTVEFLYKVAGTGTRGLATLSEGETLDIMGPLGKGFSLDPGWKNIVVVGRGVGLATLAPLGKAAQDLGIAVTAILSARNPDLLMSVERFKKHGADVVTVVDSDRSSDPENVRHILRNLIKSKKCDAMFTCGSSRLMKIQQELLFENGVAGQAAMEEHMACGLGLCYGCIRNFRMAEEVVSKRVCWEGPVFDLREVIL